MENRYDIYALFIDIIFGKIASGYYNLGFSVVFQIQFQNGVILFFGKSKQTAEISWHFFPILIQQKNGINEIALELSEKSGNAFFKALTWKKNSGFLHLLR